MSGEDKIQLRTLSQRTCERGNEYLTGFFGKARVIGFRGKPTADGTPTWNLHVTPGKAQEERCGSGLRECRSPTSSSRTGAQRWEPKSTAEKPAVDDRPFFDDPIDHIRGGV
jgi:hypothetical protein